MSRATNRASKLGVCAVALMSAWGCGGANRPAKKAAQNATTNRTDTTPPTGTSVPTDDDPAPTCMDDDSRCSNSVLQVCVGGTWSSGTNCAPGACVTDSSIDAHCDTNGGGGSDGGDGGGGGGGGGGTVATCTPCTSDPTCGDGVSAGCWIPDASGAPAFCAQDCTASPVCPTGSSCVQDAADAYKTCLPDTACDGGGGDGGGGTAQDVTVEGVTLTGAEVTAILDLCNTATETVLDVDVGLDSRAAANIVAARPIATIEELAAVAYVGTAAMTKLKTYVDTH
ncbi:MAG: helix-hairpin-helix domain-containing protein [Deltaproteobacteria bacterium]|nr:helix-hairpin-helix domain-containing protein [Deltaproteobacteria bacterium]